MSDELKARDAQLAAELDADVGAMQIAAVYAEAFLGAAETAGKTDALLDEFDSLLVDVLDPFPKLEEILASGLVTPEDKVGILDRVFGTQASELLVNFLKVVAKHGRLDCLRAIHRQSHILFDKMRNRIPVTVATAAPVDADLARQIADSLRQITGGEPVVQQVVDGDLIGGIVVRVGDTVYDGSIATQLKNVRQQMIDRSAHEIQSRRDRFRSPAGN